TRISILENGKIPHFEGKEKLDNFFEFTVSLAWLALSAGIIIGAYWAYITLGWGGFWAWDPVETGSLIPWLFITLYFHGKPFFGKRDFLPNYLVSMSYAGTLFITYLTRSGVVSSVHAFVPGGALERFLSLFIPEDFFLMSVILRFIPEERMLFLFGAILVTFLLPLIIGIKKREILKIPIVLNRKDFEVAKSRTTALKISFISGLVGTYSLIIGLIFPVVYDIIGYFITAINKSIVFEPRTVEQVYYNNILTLFGGIMLLTQFFCTFYPKLDVRRKFQLLFGGVVAGIIFAISGIFYRSGDLTSLLGQGNPILTFLDNFWTTSDKANLVLPLLLLGIVGLIVEFITVTLKEEKHLLRKSSQTMLHLSFLLILVGALFSANTTHTANITVQDGTDMEIPGTSLRIEILGLKKANPESGLHAVNYDTEFIISSGGRMVGYGISRLYVDHSNRVGHKVTIISNLLGDIYIVSENVAEHPLFGTFDFAALQIKIIPYVNILWIGCILLHFAIIPLTISRFIKLRKVLSLEDPPIDEEVSEESFEAQSNSNGGNIDD
ncbi:MAG: cytochrome c biogenesis protein CcsA, partial [Candidatus Hodarchaeales archaeon]